MSPVADSPWPKRTPAPPSPPSPPKRRRINHLNSRQAFFDQVQEAKQRCQFDSGNDVISCFPTADTVYAQHQWATFVWNSRLPDFTQTDLVNIYLFHGDSREQVLVFENVTNPTNQAGSVPAQVNDTWFGSRGLNWNGQNVSFPYYWVVQRSDRPLDGSEITQTHFTAIQTTYADSVLASMSSASLASLSSASAASVSRASVSSMITATTVSPSSGSPGGVQGGDSSSSFPKWAIAVIVILGFFAIATTCVLIFFIMRRLRRRREIESNRNSMGSSSPMMANATQEPQSPLLAGNMHDHQSSVGHGGGYAAAAGAGAVGGATLNRAPSVVSPDGASTISRAGSAGEGGPFSGADAAIMADAFRKALRKPDFAGRPVEEGDSPDQPEAKAELLNRELAEEGRDIRSVSSSRGVRVETLSDSGDTVQDHPH
ncbi:hypothetical protein VNI00_002687 [Paramarasmius palmivorus]|uniref:Uncharacterized protein n=1 Tax=Paramarasmius palmivorus TaxID=297713 RepID=A0AAW0DUX3_9AGAR